MIRFDLLTIFPEMFDGFFASKIMANGHQAGHFDFKLHNLRDFSEDPHRSVDDTPYGGGAGMVMKVEPIVSALEKVTLAKPKRSLRIYLSPKGNLWNQQRAEALKDYDQLVLVCGRYKGIDQRVIDGWIDEEVSIGDYVLVGGEVAAMVVVESMVRLIPGVLGNKNSLVGETCSPGSDLPEPPQYTRPRSFRGMDVPDVLVEGNHEKIKTWRQEMAKRLKKDQKS